RARRAHHRGPAVRRVTSAVRVVPVTVTPDLVVPRRHAGEAAGVGRRSRLVAAASAFARRPVLATLCVSVPFVLGQAWWIATRRDLGAFNVDEAGGLAAALRFHRS